MIAGVDGCKSGWIAGIETADREVVIRVFETFANLIEDQDIALVVIDVPIGLPERGDRGCDVEARRLLRERGSSVFPAPLRPMLRVAEYESSKRHAEACRIRREIEGKGCSKQLSAIMPKISEVDKCMNPEVQKRVFEGHPEVSFAYMNNGKPLCSKHTREGLEHRIRLLEAHFPTARIRLANLAALKAQGDDVLDALACLWTARRLLSGDAKHHPIDPPRDKRGLRMEINA